ncbi:NAD kinase [Actinomyces trachealis]|uniref:NAD kinase n=1 Tax=Actinomyces trachealis TaxID=2763540 RepID=UPI001892BCFD|nr:NAD kinase [Actinomyces trachealis]
MPEHTQSQATTAASHAAHPDTKQPVRRVLVVGREEGVRNAPPHARSATPTTATAERVRGLLTRHRVDALGLDDLPLKVDATGETQVCTDAGTWGIDFVLVIGGDGTILRALEFARQYDVPLVGVNTGHVGFLAEADPDALENVVERVVSGDYTVETRMVVDVQVDNPDGTTTRSWALNEAALEKRDRARMLEVAIGVDGQAVSSFGCDGLIMSTPTGSTAYAFSGGGPIVWPDVDAMLLVPIAAHALFTRPLVVGPGSCLEIVVKHAGAEGAEVWCDGRRHLPVPPGAHLRVTRSPQPVRLARLNDAPFSQRLVAKLKLPVEGWRTGAPTAVSPEPDPEDEA